MHIYIVSLVFLVSLVSILSILPNVLELEFLHDVDKVRSESCRHR